MARSEDNFLVRESEDVNLDGEIWGLELNQSDGGVKRYGIAGADGQAEKARKEAEDKRAVAESAREDAEAKRVQADAERTEAQSSNDAKQAANDEAQEQNAIAQAKNNADQAANNAAAQGLVAVIVDDYDPDTMMPNGEGQNGKMYLVPLPEARAVADSVPVSFILRSLPDGTYAAERVDAHVLAGGGDVYVEWLWINGSWERIGLSTATIDPITTEQIDAVVAGQNPQGKQVLNLTGLSYLWTKFKAAFAALKHTHKQSEVEGLTADMKAVRDSLDLRVNDIGNIMASRQADIAIINGHIEIQKGDTEYRVVANVPSWLRPQKYVAAPMTNGGYLEVTTDGSLGVKPSGNINIYFFSIAYRVSG